MSEITISITISFNNNIIIFYNNIINIINSKMFNEGCIVNINLGYYNKHNANIYGVINKLIMDRLENNILFNKLLKSNNGIYSTVTTLNQTIFYFYCNNTDQTHDYDYNNIKKIFYTKL